MIVKNEENSILSTLESVKNLINEIILVDTGSADTTKEIVKNFSDKNKITSKIIDFKWDNNFSNARNESLKHATSKWILILDADEKIDELGVTQIKELIEKDFDAFLLPQKNYTNNTSITGFVHSKDKSINYPGFYVSMICRLFRNNKNYKFSGEVHELVEDSIKKNNGKLVGSEISIHHFGNTNPDNVKKKKEYYLKLAKIKTRNSPSARSFFELGILEKENNNFPEAIETFKKSIEHNPKHRLALFELGLIHEKSKDFVAAIDYYTKSLRIKNDSEIYFNLGVCYLKKGDLKLAYRNLTKSLLLNPNKYQIYNNIGLIHERNENFREAIKMLEIGTKLNPNNAIGFYNLGIVYEKTKDRKKAIESFEKAISCNYKNKSILKQKVIELKKAEENSTSYNYSFDMGGGK
tara:strand:+ start:1963 stop:3189 length:1227 start_codon:yes stop_codon:yes gene_type:complete